MNHDLRLSNDFLNEELIYKIVNARKLLNAENLKPLELFVRSCKRKHTEVEQVDKSKCLLKSAHSFIMKIVNVTFASIFQYRNVRIHRN